jgi:cytochrome P450
MTPPAPSALAVRQHHFDPFDPALHADPYIRYAEARESAALCEGPHGMVVVTRHGDVSAALRDNRLGHGKAAPNRIFSFLGLDSPDHGPLRRLASRFFSPHAIAALEHRISGVVDELLDAALDKREVDLLTDFAYPLSLRVICGLFALPEQDQPWIREHTPPIGRLLDPPYSISDSDLTAARTSAAVFVAYLRKQIDARRRDPGDDVLSALIADADSGEVLGKRDLIPMCALLVLAGYETTANVIANSVHTLLSNPGQVPAARARTGDGRLSKTAMDELVRYDSAIQMTFRTVQRPVPVGGALLTEGTRVALLIGSANRDPRAFDRPDELDLDRTPNPHLSFGAGIHYCLGAPLARLEAGVAVGRLLSRTRHLELADIPRHKDITAAIRGLEALPVSLTPR